MDLFAFALLKMARVTLDSDFIIENLHKHRISSFLDDESDLGTASWTAN